MWKASDYTVNQIMHDKAIFINSLPTQHKPIGGDCFSTLGAMRILWIRILPLSIREMHGYVCLLIWRLKGGLEICENLASSNMWHPTLLISCNFIKVHNYKFSVLWRNLHDMNMRNVCWQWDLNLKDGSLILMRMDPISYRN